MKRTLLILTAILLLATSAFADWKADLQAQVPKLTDEDIAKLEKGEIPFYSEIVEREEGTGVKIDAAFPVKGSFEDAWAVISHPQQQVQFLDDLEKAIQIGDRTPERDVVEYHIVKFWITTKYRVIHRADKENRAFHWRLDPDFENDLAYFTGEWHFFEASPDFTVVSYQNVNVIGMWMPDFMTEYMTTGGLPHMLEQTKRRIDTKGKYTKEE